jgi:tRNA pseudouridine55 synthase
MSNSGILLLDKPSGISSAGALRALQKKLNIDRIGHSGTLDPMATGLLVVLIGNATRCAQFAEDGEKEYEATILWGKETTTDDVEGDILNESALRPTIVQIREHIAACIGTIQQVPPRISSIKIDGERAYAKARRGDVFDIPARPVTIYAITEKSFTQDTFTCVVRCGPGTYIRSIARDLGRAMGTFGTLAALRRTKSAPFDVVDAHRIEEVTFSHLVNISNLFPTTTTISLPLEEAKGLQQGKASVLGIISARYPNESLLLYKAEQGEILGILRRSGGENVLRIGCNFPTGTV